MSSSYILHKNKGFWCWDGLIELLAEYIVQEISLMDNPPFWINDYQGKLVAISKAGYMSFASPIPFEEDLKNKDDLNFLIMLLKKTKDSLVKRGQFISKEELNSFIVNRDQVVYRNDLETRELTQLVDNIIWLLTEGKEGSPPDKLEEE